MKHQSALEISDFIEFLISDEYIRMADGTFPTLMVTQKGRDVLLGKAQSREKKPYRPPPLPRMMNYLSFSGVSAKKLQ